MQYIESVWDRFLGSIFCIYGFVFFTIFGLILYKIVKQRINYSSKGKTFKEMLLCRIAYCMFVFAAFQLCIEYDFNKPSTVNVSPLKENHWKSFYSKKEVVDMVDSFKDHEGFRFDECYSWPFDKHDKLFISYSMGAEIKIEIYNSTEEAQKSFSIDKNGNNKKKQYVQISKDIEVLLYNSLMNRPADQLCRIHKYRNIQTIITIGNIVIRIYEWRMYKNDVGKATNKNIELICVALGNAIS